MNKLWSIFLLTCAAWASLFSKNPALLSYDEAVNRIEHVLEDAASEGRMSARLDSFLEGRAKRPNRTAFVQKECHIEKSVKECNKNQRCYYSCASRYCGYRENLTAAMQTQCFPAPPDSPCSSFCGQKCPCISSPRSCNYNAETGSCRHTNFTAPGSNYCPKTLYRTKDCRRENAYYLLGGVPCYSGLSNGNCYKHGEQERAALGLGWEPDWADFSDEDKIVYTNEFNNAKYGDLFRDPHGIRGTGLYSENGPFITGIHSSQDSVYSSYVEAIPNPTKKSDTCLSYQVRSIREGRFELLMRFVEPRYNVPGKRRFNVKFNGATILSEFDIVQVAGKKDHGLIVVVLFDVEKWPGQNYKKMTFTGYGQETVVKLTNSVVDLDLCYGDCAVEDNRFIMSSFHVIQFVDLKSPDVYPTYYPKLQARGLSGRASRGKKIIPVYDPCKKYNYHMCACKENGCEYHLKTGTCVKGKLDCRELNFHPEECRVAGELSVWHGVICKNYVSAGNCEMNPTTFAGVNLNGHTISNTYLLWSYTNGTVAVSEDEFHLAKELNLGNDINGDCNNILIADLNATLLNVVDRYRTQLYGDPKIDDPNKCLHYILDVTQKGVYQVVINTALFMDEDPGERMFNVAVNNVLVIPELDLARYKKKCERIDIRFTVFVKGSKVIVGGYSVDLLQGDKLVISFCQGSCNVNNVGFLISAFRINLLTAEDFGGHDTIDFNMAVNITGEAPPKEEDMYLAPLPHIMNNPGTKGLRRQCNRLSYDPCECSQRLEEAACQYDVTSGLCIHNSDCAWMSISVGDLCRKKNTFYAKGGVLCFSRKGSGVCEVEKVMHALNFGLTSRPGETWIDSHGVEYQNLETLKKQKVKIFPKIYILNPIYDKTIPVPAQYNEAERYIHRSYAMPSENSEEEDPNECLRVHIDIAGDGQYELSIKTVYPFENGYRSWAFSMKLHGLYIFREMNIGQLTRGRRAPITINVNFAIHDEARTLILEGHPPVEIPEKQALILEACRGTCTTSENRWVLSGFSVIKFSDVRNPWKLHNPTLFCGDYHGSKCNCASKRNCEYDLMSGTCEGRASHCPRGLFGKEECQRKNVYYSNGGALCLNELQRGTCGSEDLSTISIKRTTSGNETVSVAAAPQQICHYKNGSNCIECELPTAKNGLYELLMTVGILRKVKNRMLSVFLMEKEVVTLAYTDKYTDEDNMTVAINFVWDGAKLLMKGFTSKSNANGTSGYSNATIPLKICSSSCFNIEPTGIDLIFDYVTVQFMLAMAGYSPEQFSRGILSQPSISIPPISENSSLLQPEISVI